MIDIRLGIIGGGVVGSALARAFIEHVREVRVYDLQPERATHSVDAVLASDIVFVCLPTPQSKDSLACDTSYLEDFLNGVAGSEQYRGANLVIRSTVPIGFTRQMRAMYGLMNLCHSPEFLTARCAMVDAQMPSRNIIGTPIYGNPYYVGEKSLFSLYSKRWPHIPLEVMPSDESEAVKLLTNSFFATKVAVFNEYHAFISKLGLDWERIHRVLLMDGRIHPSHTQVPGPDGKFGFGPDGPHNCLKKDLASLIHQMKSLGLLAAVTGGAHDRNKMDRGRIK